MSKIIQERMTGEVLAVEVDHVLAFGDLWAVPRAQMQGLRVGHHVVHVPEAATTILKAPRRSLTEEAKPSRRRWIPHSIQPAEHDTRLLWAVMFAAWEETVALITAHSGGKLTA